MSSWTAQRVLDVGRGREVGDGLGQGIEPSAGAPPLRAGPADEVDERGGGSFHAGGRPRFLHG